MSLILGELVPRAHPSLDRPRYVPRLGPRDRRLLESWGGFVGAPTVAVPLWVALKHRSFVSDVRGKFRLALAIDPEAHFGQEAEELRPAGFDCSALGLPEGVDVLEVVLTPEEARACAEGTIDQENELGATLFVTAGHLCGGSNCVGRKNSLLIAESSIDYFEEQGLDAPLLHEPGDLEREIFIGVAVGADTLADQPERHWLIDAYSALRGDGFWVRILGLSDRAKPHVVAAAADFLFELQRRSARPVVLVGASNISIAFLAAKLAGASFGIGEHEYFLSPPVKGTGKRSLVVLHHKLLRNIQVPRRGGPGKGRDAFLTLPCFCGEHPARLPPSGSQKKPHTLACRLHQAFEITQGSFDECVALLETWINDAEERARQLDYPIACFDSWREVPIAASRSRARAA